MSHYEEQMAQVKKDFEASNDNRTVTILHHDGLFRHLRCAKSDGWNTGFHITTWPGYLCFSGDMGCFVFARIKDMFEFFHKSHINPSYWAEKLQAHEKHSGHKEFSEEVAREWVQEQVNEGYDIDVDDINFSEGEHYFRESLPDNLEHWECNFSAYKYNYLWACHAIPWAISKYEEQKKTSELGWEVEE